jgi:hypothetical protein
MDKEDIFGWCLILICILSFILPLMIGINIYHTKTVELEKYKIEMEYKRGDVNNE